MKIELISHTPDPDRLAGLAARACWSQSGPSSLSRSSSVFKRTLRRVLDRGHESVIEHVKFTFSVEGISRACSHQLVRHRIASYSQQSQRHVKANESNYVIPPEVYKNSSMREEFRNTMKSAWSTYKNLLEEGVPPEDARFVLPNAAKTNIVVTMNARSLLNFFDLRCCTHAQWEIRELADKMLHEVKRVAPTIFENAGPSCKRKGICPEDDEECELYDKYVAAH